MSLTRMQKGIALAVIHVALVGSLFGKLIIDRNTRPRVWARTLPYDPNLPIRGRYLRMRVEVAVRGTNTIRGAWMQSKLIAESGQLVAITSDDSSDVESVQVGPADISKGTLAEPVTFFIPEHAQDPTALLGRGEEIWVELTVPKKGPPRPIRLGIKRNGGPIEPIGIQR